MEVGKKYNSKYLPFNLISLAWFYSLKGDILKAHEYSNQALVTAKKYNQEYVIIKALDTIAYCFFQEGKYKEALASHRESLQYRIQTDQPSIIFLGYNSLFKYYYERFRMENNRLFLEKAGEQLLKMEDLRDKLSEDSLSMFLIRHDKALLLKHGSFKEKAQAIEIFKQLMEVESESLYHREVAIHLMDLLLENVMITEDERIVKEIETIMNRLGEYPLLRNPKAVFGYTSQQILSAKYTYYLKNNDVKALEILKHTMEQMKELQLKNLEQKIERELALLLQKTHYRGAYMKEPVDYAEFRDYLQEALDLVKQQPVD
jgi:tetratricopeptide (TPR) repeat protein